MNWTARQTLSTASRRTSSEGDGQNARRKRGRAWDGRCRPAGGPSGAPVFSRRASHHCREHSARGCSAGLNPGGKCEVAGACDEHRCSHEGLRSRGKWQPEGCAPGTDPESTPGARSEQGGSWIDMPPCDGTKTTILSHCQDRIAAFRQVNRDHGMWNGRTPEALSQPHDEFSLIDTWSVEFSRREAALSCDWYKAGSRQGLARRYRSKKRRNRFRIPFQNYRYHPALSSSRSFCSVDHSL